MKIDLVVRYLGYGKRCQGCHRIRETTKHQIREGDRIIAEHLLCDDCMDGGYVIKFEVTTKSQQTKRDRRRRIRVSRKLEAGVAKDVGGTTQPGSGNQPGRKGDVRKFDEWRIEHKYTSSVKGYTMHLDDLAAVIRHANMVGEWPAMVVDFTRVGRQFAILPYELFLEIVEVMSDQIRKHRRSKG